MDPMGSNLFNALQTEISFRYIEPTRYSSNLDGVNYERERCHIDELNASLHRYRVRYHDRTHHPTKIDLPRDPPFTCRNTVATVKCGKNLRGLATITWSDTSSIKLDSRSDCLVVTKFGWTIFNL